MIFDTMSIMAYSLGLIIIYVCCRIFAKPLKWVLRLTVNAILGGLVLAAVNFVGGFAGMAVIINPLTSLIAGLLGLPGVALVILMQYLL